MSYENINLWFAKNANDEIVTIDKINEQNKHDKYYCPICGSEVIPKAIKEDAVMTPHFAHIDRSKCDGESMIHFWIKNKLIKQGDKFNIKLDNEVQEYICKDVLIEQEYKTEFGVYKPDITIITETDETMYFEVMNTNKKKIEEYLDMWIELGNIVVEVDTKDLMNGNSVKEFKSLFYEGKLYGRTNNRTIIKIKEKINKSESEFYKKYFNKALWLFEGIKDKDINIQEEKECIFEILDLAIDNNIIDKTILLAILKAKCIDIKNEFIEHRTNIILEFCNLYSCKINNIINNRCENHEYLIKKSTYYNNIVVNIEIHENNYSKDIIIINRFSYHNPISFIDKILIKYLEDEEFELKKYLIKEEFEIIENKIEGEFTKYLKNINTNYGCSVCYEPDGENEIRIFFNGYEVITIDILSLQKYEDIMSKSKLDFEQYRNNLNIIVEELPVFYDIYDYIKNKLGLISPYKYIYYTRVNSWYPRVNRATHKYSCDCDTRGEDEFRISVKMCNKNIYIVFYKNNITINKNNIFNSEDIIVENIDKNNIPSYKKIIMNIISENIRKERYEA